MTDDYAEYQRECKIIRSENAALIDQFAGFLAADGLSKTTIRKHCSNIEFYLNEFLLYEEANRADKGIHLAGVFLGYWFIRKAMWASPASIKSNAATLKKFYTFMFGNSRVTQEDLAELIMQIKQDMPEWLATLARYDDPEIDDLDEVWGY